jgi:enamine deaminase RidA (YjgF/YER057c/UK114 family)
MSTPTERIQELNLNLPDISPPAGNYLPAVRSGNQLFLAGTEAGGCTGKVGREVTTKEAYDYARATGLMLLAVIVRELGSLDRVTRVVKVTGFVNSTPEFTDHPRVINGCSDLFVEVFGDRGRHARTAIGVGSTPDQIPLEIEAVIEFSQNNFSVPHWVIFGDAASRDAGS